MPKGGRRDGTIPALRALGKSAVKQALHKPKAVGKALEVGLKETPLHRGQIYIVLP